MRPKRDGLHLRPAGTGWRPRLLGATFVAVAAVSVFAPGAAKVPPALSLDDFVRCALDGGEQRQTVYRLDPSAESRRWAGVLGFNPSFDAGSPRGDFRGAAFGRLVKLLKPDALRYPPGTYANFYDWNAMVIDEEQSRRFANKAMLGSIKHQRERTGHLIKSDYRSYLALAQSLGQTPFIILNPLTQSLPAAQEVVSSVMRLVQGNVNWELGNEVTNPEYLRVRQGSPWSAETYAGWVSSMARFIRQADPGGKIGIVGADLLRERGYIDAPGAIERFLTDWATRMSAITEAYDAVIYHPYVNLLDQVVDQGIRKNRGSRACRSLDDDALRAIAQYQWVFAAAQEVPARYRAYVDARHAGKEVWLTENGLFAGNAEPPLNFGAYGIPRTLFNMAYFIHWLDRVPNLRAYMFHVLDYGKGEFAAVNPDGSLNANSLAFLFLRRMLDDPDGFSVQIPRPDARFGGVGPYRDVAIASVVALVSRTAAVVINISPESATLALPFPSARIRSLGGAPWARIEPGEFRSLNDIPATSVRDAPVMTLPPVSVHLIERTG